MSEPNSDCPCKKAALAKDANAPAQSTSSQSQSSRRNMLLKIGAGLNVIAGALVGVPLLGYALSSFTRPSTNSWISLGPLDKFPEGETRLAVYRNPQSKPWDGDTADIPCWVRRTDTESFQVFAINCTHLGCPVRWFQESRLFMCPCHGGAFYEDGSHASGPPPRGLFQYEHRVESGELKVLAGHLPNLAEPLKKNDV
jgi:nitrite reductase/ring-hydroxylating ferredoxin subunit